MSFLLFLSNFDSSSKVQKIGIAIKKSYSRNISLFILMCLWTQNKGIRSCHTPGHPRRGIMTQDTINTEKLAYSCKT